MNHTFILYIFIAFLSIEFAIDKFLDYLNAKHFKDNIPDNLKDIFDDEEYQKSQRYKYANYKFSSFTSTLSFLIILIILLTGSFGILDKYVQGFTDNNILQSLIYFGILLTISSLFSLPFEYYQTIVIEEKFGFNKSTKKLFVIDWIKALILNLILTGVLAGIIILIYQKTGENFWIYALIVVAIFIVFINMFYTSVIVPLFNKLKPLEDGELKNNLQDLAEKVDYNLDKIYVIDGSKRSSKANAYFSGLGPKKKVVLYDTLIQDLQADEITAVLAHEIGHYKKKHIIFNLLMSILSTGIMLFLFSLLIESKELAQALGADKASFHIGIIGFGLLFTPLSFLLGIITNFISRKFEYQADNFAKKHSNPKALISGLKKLTKKSLSNLTPHNWYVFVHYSHPELSKRIDNLEK